MTEPFAKISQASAFITLCLLLPALASPASAISPATAGIFEGAENRLIVLVTQRRPRSARAKRTPQQIKATPKQAPVRYYIDFRARTAASYGHAFLWYGRTDQREVEVAGLHPATDSVFRYMLGHLLPVPAETGASYGDLDERYLTASYRVFMDQRQARRAISYIKSLQKNTKLWHARHNNCVTFIADVANHIGLKIPESLGARPEEWVKGLKRLNGPEPQLSLRD